MKPANQPGRRPIRLGTTVSMAASTLSVSGQRSRQQSVIRWTDGKVAICHFLGIEMLFDLMCKQPREI
jgi:hypothetical protein